MYPEPAYWILGSIIMVIGTLIGFILIAAVFYVERYKTLFDTVMKAASSMVDLAEGADIHDEELKSAKTLVLSETRWEFTKFIWLLLVSSGIGLLAMLLSIYVISTIPGGSLPLANVQITQVNSVIILFAAFLVTTIATVIKWIASGFVMATFTTAQFESYDQAFRLLPKLDERIQARLLEAFKERVKVEEMKLGRKLSRKELYALLELAGDEDSDLRKKFDKAVQEEKERILRAAGRAPKEKKES
jgi:hypothetical protein